MGASVQISRRLGAIADLVTQGNRLVDVGCDHGYLPVYLKLENRIPSAIATDVAEDRCLVRTSILNSTDWALT